MKDQGPEAPEIMTETPTALESVTRGEVDMQVSTAKKYPRDMRRFLQGVENAVTKNPDVAATMFYVLPSRGQDNKPIEGPSARFAEVVASAWGNMRVEAMPLSDDGRTVTAVATAWDMESNVLVRMATQKSVWSTKKDKRFPEFVVVSNTNAAASVAFRNAVLKVVPRAMWWPLYEKARRAAVGDMNKLAETAERWLAVFEKGSVSRKRVFAFLGKESVKDIGAGDINRLQGIYTSLTEGNAKPDDIFPPEELPEGNTDAGSRKTKGKAKAKPAAEPEPNGRGGGMAGESQGNEPPSPADNDW